MKYAWPVSLKVDVLYVLLFVLAASVEPSFVRQAARLLCGVRESISPDWMYQTSENAARVKISVNGTVVDDHIGTYTIDGSSLIINEVRESDVGLYTCGQGSEIYHKLQLNVTGW